MGVAYAKVEDCIDIVPALGVVHEESNEMQAALTQSLYDASRVFESDVFAPEDYFAAAGEDYTSRYFYSNGTQFVRIHPYVSIRYIRDADNEIVDAHNYQIYSSNVYQPTGYYLKWHYPPFLFGGCGSWLRYTQFTISARWGFKCTPPDVVVAVKNLGCLMFLVNPLNRLGQNDGLTSNQEQRLRNTYNRVTNSWQQKFRHFELGL